MPPPPEAMTMTPASTNFLITSPSTLTIGYGEGTTLLHAFSPTGLTFLIMYSGCFFLTSIASSSVKKLPTGFEAVSPKNSGSSLSTRTWFTTAQTGVSIPLSFRQFVNVCCSM